MSVSIKNKLRNTNNETSLNADELLKRMRLFYSGFETIKEFDDDMKKASDYLKSSGGQAKLKTAEKSGWITMESMFADLRKEFKLV